MPEEGSSSSIEKDTDSLFDSSHNAWDNVFQGLDDMPPLTSTLPRSPLRNFSPQSSPSELQQRRQTMTAREVNIFNDMFNMIFSAVSGQKTKDPDAAHEDPLSGAGIGSGPEGASDLSDLFGKLRRHSKKFKWSAQEDQELDRKKEQMELCETDQQLLEWAMKEVFEESIRYEEAARQAVQKAEASASEGKDHAKELQSPLPLQPPFYPHILALLMHTFRERYADPHLALAIFEHARRLSIASYVFGCTTPAYNELLETRWACFRDLRGVADALQEMRVNGVEPDGTTRKIVERLRREVGDRNLWQEETELETGEVFELLNKIEALSVKQAPPSRDPYAFKSRSKRWNVGSEKWKFEQGSSDDYQFGEWDYRPRRKQLRKRPPPRHDEPMKLAFE